jgi:hypothetical protein
MGVTIGAQEQDGCAYLWSFDGGNGQNELPDVTALTIETFTEELTPEFETTATDDNGNVAAVRRGPLKLTFTLSGYGKAEANLKTYTDGDKCTLNIKSIELGQRYDCYIEKWAITGSNNDFLKCELTAVTYPNAQFCCPEA